MPLTSSGATVYVRPLRQRSILLTLLVVFGASFGAATPADARGPGGRATASNPFQLFDANIRYTSGIFVPLPTYTATSTQPFTAQSWRDAARSVSRVAADGATLLLIRAQLPAGTGSATFTVRSEPSPAADPGTLWRVDDQGVVDASSQGGIIDTDPPGPSTLTVPTVAIGGRTFAFLLYRAPRNFDGGATGSLATRTVTVFLLEPSTGPDVAVASLTIVRPLVVFIHGTFADNDSWIGFPLWRDSANELDNWRPPSPGALPFAADRISFNWIWNATGGVVDNAETVLSQLVRAMRDWREATSTAATQADVVTHSFGGFIARQVVQTQADRNPLTPAATGSFRTAANWGHGSIHKLITLAATHRGSAKANASAFVNQNGASPGFARQAACLTGSYIDQGALRDQMLLSPALRALGETRVPGHAVVGSGRALLDPSGYYVGADAAFLLLDKSSGPYATALSDRNCPFDALDNYTFNLDKNTPPFTGSGVTCSETPNYDLVVSAYSSAGLQPQSATTTATDLEQASGLTLVGRLNHSGLIAPKYGSTEIVGAVSDRLAFLLRQSTTSSFFSPFPAVASVAPNAVEQQLGQYDPAWLQTGNQCPAPSYGTSCTASYSAVKVVPSRLALEDATPAPLFVYGLLNGQWVLAYSPAVTNRNCPVTFTSSDSTVVRFVTNTITGATVPVANGVGTATIQVTVQGFAGSIPAVPVVVGGVGN